MRGRLQHFVDVVVADRFVRDRDFRIVKLRRQSPAGHVDDDALDFDAGHAFGGVDGETYCCFGGVEIDDGAAFDAARTLMTDAEHFAAMRSAAQRFGSRRRQPGDEANDLRRADVEDRQDCAFASRNLS